MTDLQIQDPDIYAVLEGEIDELLTALRNHHQAALLEAQAAER